MTCIDDVVYLIYRNNKKLYKLEIMRNGEVSRANDPVQLSTTDFVGPSNLPLSSDELPDELPDEPDVTVLMTTGKISKGL